MTCPTTCPVKLLSAQHTLNHVHSIGAATEPRQGPTPLEQHQWHPVQPGRGRSGTGRQQRGHRHHQHPPTVAVAPTLHSLPGIGHGEDGHERFAAAVKLVGRYWRYLCLFRGDGSFGLVHFCPTYERAKIHPVDNAAYGHLPPMSWLRPMMKMAGHARQKPSNPKQLSDDQAAITGE